ncbi:hypothetical protein [Streptococcus cuniculi]|uniref:Uncharacterized protein n=1 Tax=Streptococcus cuniculi TaxID=1432788 RepID=A0A4Y9JB18_9STRE|nr:hypothetical protein [Streptococcus cuniculi]MBF0778973.1 hypothetical protein [Streptococcus cuniculi]TFU97124.1 hypothetical protein E4T82_09600 [Streptococcus cuniculi]
MKKKTMRRLLYIVAIPLLLILSYKIYLHVERGREYQSLDNVFKEMNYAALYPDDLVRLPNLSNVLNSSQAFRYPDSIKSLPIKNTLLQKDESLAVVIGFNDVIALEYKKKYHQIYFYI